MLEPVQKAKIRLGAEELQDEVLDMPSGTSGIICDVISCCR